MGAGTGNANWHLCLSHHIDNLSEYFSKYYYNKKLQKNAHIYIFLLRNVPFNSTNYIIIFTFLFSFLFTFCFIAQQRINSGLFLFEAEIRRKPKRRKIEIISKKSKLWYHQTMILFRKFCYFGFLSKCVKNSISHVEREVIYI